MEEQNALSKLDELTTELLNKDPLTLAVISAVPYFGGTLTTLFSAKWLKLYQERTRLLFQQLGEQLNNLDEQTINKGYFDTDEGVDLLIKAVEESTKTRSEEKRDLIARVLCGAVIDYKQDTYAPEEYLYLISELTIQELRVARSMYENRPETPAESWNRWEQHACDTIGIDKANLHTAISRLGSAGLLQSITAGLEEGKGVAMYVPEYGEGGRYMVTEAFDRLMSFLQLEQ